MAPTDLIDPALAEFTDAESPGRWFDTAADAERLVLRPADPVDGATPSGAGPVTEAAVFAGERAPDAHSGLIARAPRGASHWLAVAEAAVRGPLQIAVACDSPASELLAAARALAPGGAIVVGGAPDSSELLAGRGRVDGADAAYVCRGPVCALPVTSAGELAAALGDRV